MSGLPLCRLLGIELGSLELLASAFTQLSPLTDPGAASTLLSRGLFISEKGVGLVLGLEVILSHLTCVLGLKLRSSVKQLYTFNPWSFSLDSPDSGS